MADWANSTVVPAEAEAGLTEGLVNVRLTIPAAPRDSEALKAAASKGWVAPQPTVNLEEASKAMAAASTAANEAVSQIFQQHPQFAADAAKYEYVGEQGDLGPINEELERELFGGLLRVRKANNCEDVYNTIKVISESTASDKPAPIRSFDDAGFHPAMLNNIKLCGYEVLLPIQCYAIPAILRGHDVVGIAQTGSGKTLAYLAPSLSKLMGKAKKLRGPRGDRVRAEPLLVVVVPTRELCIQIFDEARRLCYRSMLRPCVAYGGGPKREQKADIQRGCDVLIATPGRLIDFLHDPETLSLHRTRFTIIDEADEMMQEDWAEQLSEVMAGGGATQDAQHQYLLFSATFSAELRKLAKKYLQQDYVRIRIGRIGSTVPNIKQQIIWVDGNKKMDALYDLIIAGPACRTLIFAKSKPMVDKIDDFLYHKGMPVTSLHSERSQLEREDSIRAFRSGKCPIMVATGVSSRGLDVANVLHVINYDLPSVEYGGSDEYIHRIGRTGRLGNSGQASSFYNDADEPLAPFLAKILIENGQEVPDFLESYKPADGEPLDFEDASEDEEDASGDKGDNKVDGGDDWGTGGAGPIAERERPKEAAWGTGQATSGADAG